MRPSTNGTFRVVHQAGEPVDDDGVADAVAVESGDLARLHPQGADPSVEGDDSKSSLLPTLEGHDTVLASRAASAGDQETAPRVTGSVAAAYRAAGVGDFAYRHLQRAIRLEPCDSWPMRGWRRSGAIGDAGPGLGQAHTGPLIAGRIRPAPKTRSEPCSKALGQPRMRRRPSIAPCN